MRVPVELGYVDRLRFAVREYGESGLAARSAHLLHTGEGESALIEFLGGKAAHGVIDGSWPRYWAQAWGARVLETYWVAAAANAVIAGLRHPEWRVRMACARVCAVQQLDCSDDLAALVTDQSWRVRDAAAWALGRVGSAEHALGMRPLLDDPEEKVRARAQAAIAELASLLDRPTAELLATQTATKRSGIATDDAATDDAATEPSAAVGDDR